MDANRPDGWSQMLPQSVWGPVRHMCGVIPTAGRCVKPGSNPGCPWCDTKKLPPLLAVSSLFLLPKEVYMCLLADGSTCPHIWSLSLHSLSVPYLFFFFFLRFLCFVPSSPPPPPFSSFLSVYMWLIPRLLSNYLFPSPLHFLNKLLPVCLAQLLIT